MPNGIEEVREVSCEALVEIRVSPDAPSDWLSRVTADDFPYRKWNGDALTESDGIETLVHNAVSNGVEDASRLDGWADLRRGAVSMRVDHVEVI